PARDARPAGRRGRGSRRRPARRQAARAGPCRDRPGVMRLGTLAWFYGRRLRVHWMQELLAGLGIAIGVALVFAVQVANSSITSSAQETLKAIVGDATVQVAARDSHGFPADVADRVRSLPG